MCGGWDASVESREKITCKAYTILRNMQLLNALQYTYTYIVQQINLCHAITAECIYLIVINNTVQHRVNLKTPPFLHPC